VYLGSLETYFEHTAVILRSSEAAVLAASAKLVDALSPLLERVPRLRRIIPVESLRHSTGEIVECEIGDQDDAFLQYTSGSTMEPRGVVVTHRSIVSNVHGFMGEALRADPATDKGVTWLPLYHDMGLVGFVLGPLYWGVPVVFIPTLRFVKNSTVWLETIHKYRGTITFAPNFAFSLILRRTRVEDLRRWDLSSLKALGCGAEPIHPATIRAFLSLLGEHCGLSPRAFMPAYGLAESTLAVTMKRLPDLMRTAVLDKTVFERTGKVIPPENGNAAIEHVACGAPFSGHSVQIRAADGTCLAPGNEGEVWIAGASVASGYAGNPAAWSGIYQDGWLRTGDLGYFLDGELYISGRSKDLIILNGRNIHPQVIEWAVNNIEGVRADCAVAFSRPSSYGEELIVVVEAREHLNGSLKEKIAEAVQQVVFAKPADILAVRPGTLPRTSSGKLRRQQVRRSYLNGDLWQAAARLKVTAAGSSAAPDF
jgi:fatty-acyl-CoA synthase